MSHKPIIAVDIDDVIAANAPAFIDFSNQRFGTNLTIDDYHEHWAELWKVDHEEVEKRSHEYHQSDYMENYSPIEGAHEALKKLKEKFTLIALTSRRSSTNQITKDWLKKYYQNIFDDIVFCGFYDTKQKGSFKLTKGDFAKNINANYIIDDQIRHVLAAAKHGIKGILFGDYAWSKILDLPENIHRVKNWKEVVDYFDTIQYWSVF